MVRNCIINDYLKLNNLDNAIRKYLFIVYEQETMTTSFSLVCEPTGILIPCSTNNYGKRTREFLGRFALF